MYFEKIWRERASHLYRAWGLVNGLVMIHFFFQVLPACLGGWHYVGGSSQSQEVQTERRLAEGLASHGRRPSSSQAAGHKT